MTFSSANAAESSYTVNRGQLGSTATAHSSGDPVFLLDNSTIIVPFAPGFFENASSSNYIHTVALPDVRIIAAEFLVNNAFGSSQALQQSYAVVPPESSLLRTLSGGQFSLKSTVIWRLSKMPPSSFGSGHSRHPRYARHR